MSAHFFLYFYTLFSRMHNKNIVTSILGFFIGFGAIAQNTPPPPMPPPPPGLPIDGGVIALFLAALVYGIYKTYKFSKKTA
ncbi:MAG: PID-CTERM protein-sorting domain-containing protein [Winogradskyella sp.]|uniref:PID-CTERM protein-sorting domain-containing protein n=1 Tax=Winogradskyella sp. TaxID=1883156 RepID=UPI00385A0CF9